MFETDADLDARAERIAARQGRHFADVRDYLTALNERARAHQAEQVAIALGSSLLFALMVAMTAFVTLNP